MARGKGRGPRKPVGRLQQLHDQQIAQERSEPIVPIHAEQHGIYERHMGRVANRGGTPVARWKHAQLLSPSQEAAIEHCLLLWRIISASGKLVANLDRTVFGCPGDGHSREIEARDDLKRMKGYFPPQHWDVFENVVRFDEPAGVAGSRLERAPSTRETAARLCVQFVADVITMKERLSY